MIYYIGLGTNIGDLYQNLENVIINISNIKALRILKKSSFHKTQPWGKTDQSDFLNAVIMIETDIEPINLLMIFKNIETEMGKNIKEKWGPRIIDIDILFCDDITMNNENLTIPHPYLHEREFVLLPMIEIASDFIHPVFNLSIKDVFKRYIYTKNFKNKKIIVAGDLMLDHYLFGNVERISPEAPVPIVDIKQQEYRLGGAANVVNNIHSLSATPIVVGLTGVDSYSDILINHLNKKGITTEYIIKDNTRPTTVKSRIFASGQQIMRYDQEQRQDVSEKIEIMIIEALENSIDKADAIILEDYNKGLLTPKIIEYAIEKANKKEIPITVDPKFKNFFLYKNCTVFKPNFNELQKNLNIDIVDDDSLKIAAKNLFAKISPKYLIITLGERGLMLFDKTDNIMHIPTFAKEVFDVSGAGDTVISVLTLCLAAGEDIKNAATIANKAAGIVCGKMGIHPITINEIFAL